MSVAVVLLAGARPVQPPEAKALFERGAMATAAYVPGATIPFVGIQYWLETQDGTRLTERLAAAVDGRFTLHIRANTTGFLGVWTTLNGERLTGAYGGYAGHRLVETAEYVAPGTFRLSGSASDERVIVVFSRSQTEQATDVASARIRLSQLASPACRTDRMPCVIRGTDEATAGLVGTYVVNREGGPLAVEIRVTISEESEPPVVAR